MASLSDVVGRAKLPTASVSLLLDDDLRREHADAETALREHIAGIAVDSLLEKEAKESGRLSKVRADRVENLTDDDRAALDELYRLRDRVLEVEGRQESSLVEFTFRALPPGEWAALLDRHPAVDDKRQTIPGQVDMDSLTPELLELCMVEPEPSPEGVNMLLGVVSTGQKEILHITAWDVNAGGDRLGKSRVASALTRSTAPRSSTATTGG